MCMRTTWLRRISRSRRTPCCPGFVNLHTHAAMTLLRGYGDDRPLMEWLRDYIWPVEARHISRSFVRDGTMLACAEMLRGGITCFNDMYFFPEAAAEAAVDAGMRAAHRDHRDRNAFALRGRCTRLSREGPCDARCAARRAAALLLLRAACAVYGFRRDARAYRDLRGRARFTGAHARSRVGRRDPREPRLAWCSPAPASGETGASGSRSDRGARHPSRALRDRAAGAARLQRGALPFVESEAGKRYRAGAENARGRHQRGAGHGWRCEQQQARPAQRVPHRSAAREGHERRRKHAACVPAP